MTHAGKASSIRLVSRGRIAGLIRAIEAANASGTKTAGSLPIMRQVLKQSDAALASILAGNSGGATSAHRHNINMMQAFVRELDGSSGGLTRYPEAVDFRARADAILSDLPVAQAR